MTAIAMVTTVGCEEQANAIAREIVARRQAACVNILPGVRSVYRWKGKICHDHEMLLIVKTLATEFDAVAETIREIHTYELPEILSFPVDRGEASFLAWIREAVDKSVALEDDDEDEEEDALHFAGAEDAD